MKKGRSFKFIVWLQFVHLGLKFTTENTFLNGNGISDYVSLIFFSNRWKDRDSSASFMRYFLTRALIIKDFFISKNVVNTKGKKDPLWRQKPVSEACAGGKRETNGSQGLVEKLELDQVACRSMILIGQNLALAPSGGKWEAASRDLVEV